MSDEPEELDFEERRKRLEQLFAAEPHLSPTMRARQLYEEPAHQSNGHHPAHGSSTAASPPPRPLTELDSETIQTEAVAAVEAVLTKVEDGFMTLAEARRELKERTGPEYVSEYASGAREPDGLDSLRDSVLACWRRDMLSDC